MNAKIAAIAAFFFLALTAIILTPAPARADDPKLTELSKIVETTGMLIKLPVKPQLKLLSELQIKQESCVQVETCPPYVSVHVPKSDTILVNAEADFSDLNNQAQIVHVLAMFAMEKSGQVSPDAPCSFVAAKHAYAHVIQAAYIDIKLQELAEKGISPPEFRMIHVMSECTKDPVRGEF